MTDNDARTRAQQLLSEDELREVIIHHLAFYAGWPRAISAVQVAKRAFEN